MSAVAIEEFSILFKGAMVRAILDGRKTQTRRIIDPQPPASCVYAINGNKDKAICMADDTVDVPERPWFVPPYVNKAQCYVECRYGKLGDRLWVRETWAFNQTAISKAKTACEVSGHVVSDHFVDVNKMIQLAKGAEREIEDIMLTRYACYLIAQNGDPRKQEIACQLSLTTVVLALFMTRRH